MNRAVFALVAILFLLSVSSVAGLIKIVKADSGTIYINADGSITPSTVPIYSADHVTYTLTGNITANADGIVIERDNIILDGAGYTVAGSESGNGTTLVNRSNVTVNNMTMKNFVDGIYLYSSSNNIFSGDNVTANNGVGIVLETNSDDNTLSGNDIANNYDGIAFDSNSGNTLSGNNVTSNTNYDIFLNSSSNNFFYVNDITNSEYGIGFSASSDNFIFLNNFVKNTNQISTEFSTNTWNNSTMGNYWSDYLTKYPNATQVDSSGVWNTPYVIDANNTDYYPLANKTTLLALPYILILSPESMTYNVTSVPLTFTVDQTTFWMGYSLTTSWIGYSLDGQSNITVSGNTTLTGLAYGVHNIIVFANNTANVMGASSLISFNVEPIEIINVSQNPPATYVTPTDVVSVNATITDSVSTVAQVSLNYTNGNGTWIAANMTNLQGNIWNSTIPQFPISTGVTYIITVFDNAGNTLTTQQLDYTFQYTTVPEFTSLLIVFLLPMATLLAVIIYKKKGVKTSQS